MATNTAETPPPVGYWVLADGAGIRTSTSYRTLRAARDAAAEARDFGCHVSIRAKYHHDAGGGTHRVKYVAV